MKKLLKSLPIHPSTHLPIYPFTRLLKKFLLPFFFLLSFLTGCATKTTPVYISINSPVIKISDEGFLKEGPGYKEIVIYKAGFAPVKLLIKEDRICVNNRCFNKYLFMRRYFKGFKKDIFDKILNKKPLSLKFYKKTKNGFLEKSDNIYYLVRKNSVLFKDKKEHITIFIKYLKENND